MKRKKIFVVATLTTMMFLGNYISSEASMDVSLAEEVAMVSTSSTATENAGTCGENLTWVLEEGTLKISGSGAMENYSRSNAAPWKKTDVKKVKIEDGVTTIGDYAFESCRNLQDVELSDSITMIGDSAFYWCKSLAEIALPKELKTIKQNTFFGCEALISIFLPEKLEKIQGVIFDYCNSLTEIQVDAKNSHYISVDGVLYNKAQTVLLKYPSKKTGTSYTIPNTVTSMKSRVFMECENLTTVNLSSGLTSIGWATFVDCKNLTSVILPQGLTSIPNNAFEGCEKLTSVNIPVGVTSIGEKSFSSCKSLTTLQLPTGLTSIGKEAFYRCESLTEVHLPEKIKTIEEKTFSECKNLTNVKLPETLISIGEMAFSSCKNLISVEFPQTLTTIEGGAFSSCNKLSVVNLPKGVENIENGAFLAYGLTEINVDGQNEYFSSLNGVLYNKGKTVLLVYPKNKPETRFVVPDGVESIQDGAFGGVQKLNRIEFPESVTSIGESAFSNSVIAEVLFPKSLVSIGKLAFYGCFYLEVIEIPKGVTHIGEMAFEDYGHRRILYCYRDSQAHAYAERENIPYEFLSESTGLPEKPSDPPAGDSGNPPTGDYSNPPTGDSGNPPTGNPDDSLPGNPNDSENESQGNSSINKPGNSNTDLSNKPSMNPSEKPSIGVSGNNQTIQSIHNAIVMLSNTEYMYDGKEKQPSVMVECNGKILTEKMDYTVTYYKNKNIGTATVIVYGKNNYTGSIHKKFQIGIRRGSCYTIGNNQYKITEGFTVSFVGIKSPNTKKVMIPKTIKIGGKKFKVTSIGEKALWKKRKITSVLIGENVMHIGKEAFKNCKKLKSITIRSKKLKSIGENVFRGITSHAKIKVPAKKLRAYKKLLKNKKLSISGNT